MAALRLPFTVATGFVLVLSIDAAALLVAHRALPGAIAVDSFGSALLAALVIAAVSIALEVVTGTNDEDYYGLRVIQRVARRRERRPRQTSRESSSWRSTGSRSRC